MQDHLIKFLKSARYYDCDWNTIYADTPRQQFLNALNENILLVDYFLKNYNEFERSAENIFHLMRISNKSLFFSINDIKEILFKETDDCTIDSILQFLETYNLDYKIDLSFLKNKKYKYKWLKDYAHSIADH